MQEMEGAHLREWLVRETDVVERAVDVESGDVFNHVESVGDVGGVENEVEFVLPGLEPIGLGGDDEVLGATFDGVVLLVWRVGEGVDVGTESASELKTKVTETATENHVMIYS